ncbi:glucose-1-phosphate thymidylyltransferase [bacterium]|nr:glucose-1-phosphate thymidylyltransferase [bacterium]
MKALVLSGGRGTRLRPITHTGAKQLIPIANKPILFYGLEAIADAGIKDVGIIVGETKEEIKEVVGAGKKWGLKVTYIEQEVPLGLAHAVKISQNYLKDEPFVMYLGDNLIKEGLASLVREFKRKKPNALILLSRVKEPQRFGVAELEKGKIVRLTEKPKRPKSDLALVGVYMFDKNIFEAVNNIKPSWRKEYEITDAIQYLIDKKYKVHSHIIQGWWKDTGKVEDVLEANRLILESIQTKIEGRVDGDSRITGRVIVERGARVINSVIRGPAIIGKRSKIINSYIGPFTSIYWGTTIKNSEMEHSIVMEETNINNISGRINESLIGKEVSISKSNLRPQSYRFTLGDRSKIEVL